MIKHPRGKGLNKALSFISFSGLHVWYGWSTNMPHPFYVTISYRAASGKPFIKKSKLFYYRIKIDAQSFIAKIWVNPQKEDDTYLQLFLI